MVTLWDIVTGRGWGLGWGGGLGFMVGGWGVGGLLSIPPNCIIWLTICKAGLCVTVSLCMGWKYDELLLLCLTLVKTIHILVHICMYPSRSLGAPINLPIQI